MAHRASRKVRRCERSRGRGGESLRDRAPGLLLGIGDTRVQRGREGGGACWRAPPGWQRQVADDGRSGFSYVIDGDLPEALPEGGMTCPRAGLAGPTYEPRGTESRRTQERKLEGQVQGVLGVLLFGRRHTLEHRRVSWSSEPAQIVSFGFS